MAANVTLTAALRSNLLSLQGTQRLLDTTQLRLATGRKVNSALDNANAFFASQALNFRASDLSNLLDGMGQALQVLKAADQGITTMTSLVEQAQSAAQGARDTLSSQIVIRSRDFSAAHSTGTGNVGSNIAAGTITLNNGGAAMAVTTDAGMSIAVLRDRINAHADNGGRFVASLVDAGTLTGGAKRLEIKATDATTNVTFATAAGNVTALQTAVAGGQAGSVSSVGGVAGGAIAASITVAAASVSSDAASAEAIINGVRTQINNLIKDTGYRGTNLLNGDTLTTQFNETNTSTQTVTGVTYNAAGLGISAANFSTSAAITTALNEMTAALTTLRSQAKSFGNNLNIVQTRQDFTQNLINTLKEGADKLTLADKNEEGANLLSLQTSQQLGITALSLASQASQSVLQLFQ